MIKNFIEKSWLLIVASLAFGLLLAGTNEYLDPLIKEQQAKKFSDLAGAMVEGAADFQTVSDKPIKIKSSKGKDIEVKSLKRGVDKDGKTLGWAFEAVGSGFADKIKLVIAVDAKFETIKGFGVLSSNETPGFGDQIKLPHYRNQFEGAPAGELTLVKTGDAEKIDSEIVAISGATVSSEAVVKIINNAITQIKEQMQKKELIGNGK